MNWIDRVLEWLVHGRNEATHRTEETPAEVLEALEWDDTDSGDDLAERAEKVKGTPAHA